MLQLPLFPYIMSLKYFVKSFFHWSLETQNRKKKTNCRKPSVNAGNLCGNWLKSFQTAMIITKGFQDFLIYLVMYFWSLVNSPNLVFSKTFSQKQRKQNSLISFFIIERDYNGFNYHTFFKLKFCFFSLEF